MAKVNGNSTDDGKVMLNKIAKAFGYDHAYVICSPYNIFRVHMNCNVCS